MLNKYVDKNKSIQVQVHKKRNFKLKSYNTNLFKLRNKYAYIKSNEDDVLSLC